MTNTKIDSLNSNNKNTRINKSSKGAQIINIQSEIIKNQMKNNHII
jgi:hypothetical protein